MNDRTILQPDISELDEASLRYILKLVGPMVVTTVSFTIMQFVDRFMVSRLGTEALAAILPASLVSFLPACFAMGITMSVTTFASQSLGRGEKKDCSSYCWQAIYLGLAYFTVIVAVMWPAAPHIFKMMGHEQPVVAMEVTYLRIMLYSMFVQIFLGASGQFFMGIHRPVVIMYAALCGQIVNVGANYVLIFGKFGFPEMGIAGAGWGTFIGLSVGATVRMYMFLSSPINSEYASRHTKKVDLKKMKSLLKVGLPAGLELTLNVAFWGILLFGLIGRFGKEALAATSAVLSCTNVSVMPVVGIGMALSAAVGKSIGKGRKDLASKQTSVCLKVAMVYMGLIGVCFFLFRNHLMGFWSSDEKVIDTGINLLICAAVYQVFHAARIIYGGSLRGAGDTLWLAIVSAIGAIVILGGGGLLMLKFFTGLGALGPWIAATASIIVVGLANRWRFKSNGWMRIDLFKAPAASPAEIEPPLE